MTVWRLVQVTVTKQPTITGGCGSDGRERYVERLPYKTDRRITRTGEAMEPPDASGSRA